jgi:hypothetical protein
MCLRKVGLSRLDHRKSSHVLLEKKEVSIYNDDDWEQMIEFYKINLEKFYEAFSQRINQINNSIKVS